MMGRTPWRALAALGLALAGGLGGGLASGLARAQPPTAPASAGWVWGPSTTDQISAQAPAQESGLSGAGATHLRLACIRKGARNLRLTFSRPLDGLSPDEVKAARAGIASAMLMPADGGPFGMFAGDVGAAQVGAEEGRISVTLDVARATLTQLAAAGEGATLRLNASELWEDRLGGRELAFPTGRLAEGLGVLAKGCG